MCIQYSQWKCTKPIGNHSWLLLMTEDILLNTRSKITTCHQPMADRFDIWHLEGKNVKPESNIKRIVRPVHFSALAGAKRSFWNLPDHERTMPFLLCIWFLFFGSNENKMMTISQPLRAKRETREDLWLSLIRAGPLSAYDWLRGHLICLLIGGTRSQNGAGRQQG